MNLKEIEAALAQAVDATEKYLERIEALPAVEALRTYARLKWTVDALGAQMTRLNKLQHAQQYGVIPDIMAANGIRNFTDEELGVRFGTSSRWSATILNKPAAYDWLRNNGHGALIVQTVNAQTLGSFAGSYIEDTGEDLPADLFSVKQSRYATVTKVRK